jgi:long-chain acyl-CoA synthetase
MEASTVPASEVATGSRTIADLLPLAAEKFGDAPAVRQKVDGAWQDVSFREVAEIAREISLGLVDIGVAPGDRVCILCQTRPEWTYADFGITQTGAVVVPIYPTNSPEECEWVVGNSGATAVVCEDASQIAKIRAVAERLPDLETIIAIDPSGDVGDAIPLDDLRERGRGGDPAELERRQEALTLDDPFTLIYTSGTTGPPKGCILTHGNYRSVCSMAEASGVVIPGEVNYLFLPLAHAFALLIQLISFDVGATIAYFSGDPQKIIPELSETKPTYFPSVPRIFEKLYTIVTQNADREQLQQAIAVGMKVRELQRTGQEVPAELQAGFDLAEEKLFKNVRAAFGGQLRQAVTGAAPIAKEILEFFYACGVPVLEGYGMTETSTAATISTVDEHKFGTVGKPMVGVQVKIADDGEVLLKGDNIFKGYWRNEAATAETLVDGWLHTGDLGSVDDEGYLSITGRKKDIIITAGGKNITPANLENDLKQSPWISQAVMHGDRRPFPVALITLDEEEVPKWARDQGLPDDIASLANEPKVHELIQGVLDEVNRKYANVEQIKKFTILDHDLSQETGELTPTLKVKRNVVQEKYADVLDAMYQG